MADETDKKPNEGDNKPKVKLIKKKWKKQGDHYA